MLSVLIFLSLVCQGLSVVSYGKDFITAFPENIAYYYPQDSLNALKVTAFNNDTTVTVSVNHTNVYKKTLHSGHTEMVYLPKYVEQYQFTRSLNFVKISSTNIIVVLWISKRGDSMQTTVVQPFKNLGHHYFIPSLNYTELIGPLYNLSNQSAQTSRRYSFFRVIIINAENRTNSISVQRVNTEGQTENNITLSPYELFQLPSDGSEITVLSSYKVAVLLTHPCVETTGCRCNMVVSQVLPRQSWGQSFVLPSMTNMSMTWLQVTSTRETIINGGNLKDRWTHSSEILPFPNLEKESQFIITANNVSLRLLSQGLILELIPETMFSACYLVQFNSTQGEVLVIAQTDLRDDVHIDSGLLLSTNWRNISNTSYSSVSVSLDSTHVIWHPTSKIGVYMLERMESGILYGGPAITLNDVPDRDGCVLTSANFTTGSDLMTWPESNQYCLNITDQLANPSSIWAQKEMVNWIKKEGVYGDLWIGLRRSLLTLEWYWQNSHESVQNVSYTHWAAGQPNEPQKGMCASASLDANMDFYWKSGRCCTKMKPVCYIRAQYFSDITYINI